MKIRVQPKKTDSAQRNPGCLYARAHAPTVCRLLLPLRFCSLPFVAASAIEVKVSAQALERTLQAQALNGPQGRYYLRARQLGLLCLRREPRVTFVQTAFVVRVHAKSKLGHCGSRNLHRCLPSTIPMSRDPEAERERRLS